MHLCTYMYYMYIYFEGHYHTYYILHISSITYTTHYTITHTTYFISHTITYTTYYISATITYTTHLKSHMTHYIYICISHITYNNRISNHTIFDVKTVRAAL